jgi:hypothetical protein
LREAGCEVATVEEAGLKGVQNGALLRAIEGRFDVFVTADQGVGAQQNLRGRRLAIVIVPTNRRSAVMERAADIVATVLATEAGQQLRIAGDGSRTRRQHEDIGDAGIDLAPVPPFRFGRDRGD